MFRLGGAKRSLVRYSFPVAVSVDGKSLVDQFGQPYFINGDTGWMAIVQLNLNDARKYLDDRAARGYNAVILELIEKEYATNNPNNLANDPPFTTPGDFTTPGTPYFSHADAVIAHAASRGLTAFLFPLYLGFNDAQGWRDEMAAQTTTQIESWGTFCGNRYKNFSNIVWVLGGDTNPQALTGIPARIDAFVTGLRAAGDTHLISAHVDRGSSPAERFSGVSWLQLNSTYADETDMATEAAANYAGDSRPAFMVEAHYEGEHSMTALNVRKQAYWAILAGSILGHFFGNCPLWHFNAHDAGCDGSPGTWQNALSSTCSQQMSLVGRLFQSRRHHLLVPDAAHSVVMAGYSSGANLVTTARASDGSSVISYLPTGSTVTITLDMTKIAGATARAWWWNPLTGVATLINTFATSGTQNFSPSDTNDWVLVVDNDALGMVAPGA